MDDYEEKKYHSFNDFFTRKVKEIVNTQNKTNRYVYIEPSVDFNNLSDVLVVNNN